MSLYDHGASDLSSHGMLMLTNEVSHGQRLADKPVRMRSLACLTHTYTVRTCISSPLLPPESPHCQIWFDRAPGLSICPLDSSVRSRFQTSACVWSPPEYNYYDDARRIYEYEYGWLAGWQTGTRYFQSSALSISLSLVPILRERSSIVILEDRHPLLAPRCHE